MYCVRQADRPGSPGAAAGSASLQYFQVAHSTKHCKSGLSLTLFRADPQLIAGTESDPPEKKADPEPTLKKRIRILPPDSRKGKNVLSFQNKVSDFFTKKHYLHTE